MRYIDFHCHAFPDKIAQAAVESLAHKGGGLIPRLDGSWDALATEAQEDPDCAYRLLLPIATKPTQQQSIKITSYSSLPADRDVISCCLKSSDLLEPSIHSTSI